MPEWLCEQTAEHAAMLDNLRGGALPAHTVYILLRAAVLHRMGFLIRTHSATEIAQAATAFGTDVRLTLQGLLLGDPLPEEATLLATIPLLDGGFGLGLRSQLELSKFASTCVFV